MILIKNLPYPLFSNEIELLKNKAIHVICMASTQNGSNFQIYIQKHLNADTNILNLANKVITEKEAGTLFPDYYISMYPNLPIEDLKIIFEDLIINANDNYLRSDTIIVVIEKEMDLNATIALLENISKNRENRIKIARTIYVIQN
jgi:hypothetical protein